ncbi:hypothetical protein P7C73_g1377, partial [Tremellales sp. Uapishka_1]
MRALSSPLALLALGLVHSTLAATTCNGYADLCDRSYSNVTFLGAHDSYAVGTSVADNQDKNVTAQLNDGIRALQIQTHNASDTIHVCHTSCSLLDGGTLESYLTSLVSWVQANPNDGMLELHLIVPSALSNSCAVVTLVLVNVDDLPVTSFSPIFQTAGLDKLAYSPSSSSLSINAWPTLGALIDASTPVVVFMDFEADFTSTPYIIDEFSNMWEDAFDVTDQTFGCAVNRTNGDSGSQLMLVNHFLDTTYDFGGTTFFVPNKNLLNETNAASGTGSIGTHVTNCQTIWGRNPNIILLDYYDSNGNVPFDFVATLNGVAAPTNTVTAGVATAASSTGSSSTASVSTKKLSGGHKAVLWNGRLVGVAVIGLGMLGIAGAW